jgi:hypothetical protein
VALVKSSDETIYYRNDPLGYVSICRKGGYWNVGGSYYEVKST